MSDTPWMQKKQKTAINADSQGDYEDWRADVYGALLDADMEHEADLWWRCARCGATYFVSKNQEVDENTKAVYACCNDPSHHAKAVKMTCQLRICPECARREVFRLLHRYVPVMEALMHSHHPTYRFRKIVLTTPLDMESPDAKTKYLEYASKVPKVFDELLPKGWRSEQGFIQSAEFGPQGHKLHFHLIFFGEWLDNRKSNGYKLASAWKKVTGEECEVVRIYGIKPEDIQAELIETLKYTTKFWKTDEDGEIIRIEPRLMPILLNILKGTRRIRSYGVFYNVPEVPQEPDVCPVCQSALVRWSALEWNIYAQTGWLPDEQSQHLGSDIANKSSPGHGQNGNKASPIPTQSQFWERNQWH